MARSPLFKHPKPRPVPRLDPVPGVGGANPLAPAAPQRQGFRSWFAQRDYHPRFNQMDAGHQRKIQQKYRAQVPAGAPPQATYDNPITSNGQFFDPNSQYGYNGGAGSVATSPIGDIFLEDNPDAAWMRHLASLGIDPMSAEGQWARTQLGNVKTGWNAALATNPQLRQRDYLKSLDIRGMFANQSASDRGENPGMFAPRARTISRGYG